MAENATTQRRTRRKATDSDSAQAREHTGYTVLEQCQPDSKADLTALIAKGKVWLEYAAEGRGAKGTDAIKALTVQPDKSHKPGVFKAVPGSNWNAESNNLEIVTETKTVSMFKTPGSSNGAQAEE